MSDTEKRVQHPSGWTLMNAEEMQSFLNGYWTPEHVTETSEGIWYLDPARRRSAPPSLTVVEDN